MRLNFVVFCYKVKDINKDLFFKGLCNVFLVCSFLIFWCGLRIIFENMDLFFKMYVF